MRSSFSVGAFALTTLALAAPAQAEVVVKSDSGFVVRVVSEVPADSATAWKAMTTPSLWWSAQHTFSGSSANLTLDPVPGGCFCEKLPPPKDAPATQRPGGVQHMRVIYVEPLHALRLSGALGPLQSEALNGTLTMTLKPGEGTTRILWEYVVGGFMRYKVDEIAPAVDRMLAGQMALLSAKLGPVPAKPADTTVPAVPGPSPVKPVASAKMPPAAKTPAAKPPAPQPAPAKKAPTKPVVTPAKPAPTVAKPAVADGEQAARDAAAAAFDLAVHKKARPTTP
jgi:hypothetical protein